MTNELKELEDLLKQHGGRCLDNNKDLKVVASAIYDYLQQKREQTMSHKKSLKKKKIIWFARGGQITRCGPFETQIEATNAMRLPKFHRHHLCDEFPDNVFVWPEETNP
jgi:MarR-like DNA-binding transcriptional regulator SgrR of sgrS sRNA